MPRPKPTPAPTLADTDPASEAMVLRMLADVFGVVGLWNVDAGGWEWITDERGLVRHQRIGEFWAVQATYYGKGWTWAHRSKNDALAMAEQLRAYKVKNVRVWRGKIEWEPV